MTLTGELTKDDLQARYMNILDCPMARSLNRVIRKEFGMNWFVSVGGLFFNIYHETKPYRETIYSDVSLPYVAWKAFGLFPRKARWDCNTHDKLRNRWFHTRVTYTVEIPS